MPAVPDNDSNPTLTRRANALALFQAFAEARMRAGEPPKGMEQAFAAQLQISPSMWSQIKASRPIGDKLARQIEAHCQRPAGWLDAPPAPNGASGHADPSPAEQQFLALALKAWRASGAEQRREYRRQFKQALAPAERGGR